jgi:HEAT repeat protein
MTRRRYDWRKIRTLLTEGFSYQDLHDLCFDDFRPVYDQFGPEVGKARIIALLLEYVVETSQFETLLTKLKALNPARYEEHHPYELTGDLIDGPDEAAYLEAVAQAYRYLPLEGSDQRIPLTDVFVMLQAAKIRPRRDVELTEKRQEEMGLPERLGLKAKKESEAKAEAKSEPPPPVEVSAVLREHPCLVILGEPGGGKTTLLRYLALCLATGQAEAKLNLTEKYLPVFIELRRLASGEAVDQFLLRDLAAAPYHLSPTTIKEWLNDGRLMLLLDALDEVPLEQQAHLREQVERFATSPKWSDNRLILTSRVAAYREGSGLSAGRFSHYTLRPLSRAEDTRLYAEGWLRSLGKTEAEAKAEAEQMMDYMTKQPGLLRVISNPLQLRLAVIAYQAKGLAALKNRAGLYRHYLEETLWQREQARGTCPSWDKVMTGLERLAWTRHTVPGGQLNQQHAVKRLGEGGYEQLAFLRQRTGLIVEIGQTEQGERLLAFSHQTYQEYLIARVLSRAWQKGKKQREAVWRMLKPRLHHPDWRETILLLAGMLSPTEATELVRYIRRVRSSYENILHRDLLLALACLSDGVKVEPAVSGSLINEAVTLLRATPFQSKFTWLLQLPFYRVRLGHYARLKEHLAEMLAGTGDDRAVEPLVTALGDEDMHVSWSAAQALGRWRDNRAVEPLLAALRDRKGAMRQRAAIALGQLGEKRAVEPLVAILRDDEDRYVRRSAANALGQLGDGRAVEPLIAALRDEDEYVCCNAADALGQLGDDRAVEPLVAALRDAKWLVRLRVATALEQLGGMWAVGPLVAALQDEKWYVREDAAQILGHLGDGRAVEPLITALRNENKDVRRRAAYALGQLGDGRAVEPLITALRDENEDVRRSAADALGQLADGRAVEPLIAALRDESELVREDVADALRQLRDVALVQLLAALRDEDETVRGGVAYALGQLGDGRAVEPLIAALRDENEDVRRSAAKALGQLGDVLAVEPLVVALRDEKWLVRGDAAYALGQLGDGQAVEPLIAALQDKDEFVRGDAAEALGQLRDGRAVEPLVAALQDKDEFVRWSAAEALGYLGDGRAVEPLVVALQKDEFVHWRVVEALGRLGDGRAVEPLIAVLRDKHEFVRRKAVEALGQLGDGRAVEPLIIALWDENEDVRGSAVAALGQLSAKLIEVHCRPAVQRLWREAIEPDQPDVYELLSVLANWLVVLEVERLPPPKHPDC